MKEIIKYCSYCYEEMKSEKKKLGSDPTLHWWVCPKCKSREAKEGFLFRMLNLYATNTEDD